MGGLRLHALTPIHTTGAHLHLHSLRTLLKNAECRATHSQQGKTASIVEFLMPGNTINKPRAIKFEPLCRG